MRYLILSLMRCVYIAENDVGPRLNWISELVCDSFRSTT